MAAKCTFPPNCLPLGLEKWEMVSPFFSSLDPSVEREGGTDVDTAFLRGRRVGGSFTIQAIRRRESGIRRWSFVRTTCIPTRVDVCRDVSCLVSRTPKFFFLSPVIFFLFDFLSRPFPRREKLMFSRLQMSERDSRKPLRDLVRFFPSHCSRPRGGGMRLMYQKCFFLKL